jgi:hypothetical protein
VLIVSPGDVQRFRDVVHDVVLHWNAAGQSSRRGVVMLPVRWEYDVVPAMGADAQSIINEQIVDDADIVIALFHSRLGSATPRAVSGSAEEIERGREHNLGTHVFICDAAVPRDHQPQQLAAVRAYEKELQEKGLLGTFTDESQLRGLVDKALDRGAALLEERLTSPAGKNASLPVLDSALVALGENCDLPEDAAARAVKRLDRTLQRQGAVCARSVRYDVEVGHSSVPGYISYDLTATYRYDWRAEPGAVPFAVDIFPYAMTPTDRSSRPAIASRYDRQLQPWSFQLWPPLNDASDWSDLRQGLDISASLFKATDKRQSRMIDFDPVPFDPGGQRRDLAERHEARDPVTLTDGWDTLEVVLRGVPHPMGMPAVHLYASEVCTGEWEVVVKSPASGFPACRLMAVTGPDVEVESERLGPGVVRIALRPDELAILPDDAVVITLTERS